VATAAEPPPDPSVVAALATWRQGDCSLAPATFVFAAAWETDGDAAGAAEPALEGVQVHGLVLVTQTCDVVQVGEQRSFVQVAPLVAVDEDTLRETARGRRIHYGYVPGVADRGLVADLGRVMTLSKSALAALTRVEGCRTDEEGRSFRRALARKLGRAAFPDDFVALVDALRRRIVGKHGRASREGEVLRGLWDIRVVASPSWEAAQVDLMFWFICDDEVPHDAATHLDRWLGLTRASGRFATVDGQFVTLDHLTARDYVDSDPLDFEHLSAPTSP